jgi:hypothetical protein
MKTVRTVLLLVVFSLVSFAFAGDKNSEKPVPDTRTVKKADAIYNEIMMTLTPEMKARIDSSRTSIDKSGNQAGTIDSAKQKAEVMKKNELEKEKYLESLPDDVQLRVEKAIREMEQRQKERALEFKEIKRSPR